jgi:hypothetical protein
MEADEKQIHSYLKSLHGQFISGREIARRACGKARYQEDPTWASPLLLQLVGKGIIESDTTGHYRVAAVKRKSEDTDKKWVSPKVKDILEKSGKNFTHVIREEDLE